MSRTLALLALVSALALHLPPGSQAQKEGAPRLDRFGDPLPVGALARLGTLRFHSVRCAAYSPDGKIVATANDNELTLWDVATSKRIRQLTAKRDSPTGLIFSHDGKKLAVVAWGGASVEVWDLATFAKVLFNPDGRSGGGDWSSAAAFSADDKTVFVGTSKALFAYDLTSGQKLHEFPLQVPDKVLRVRFVALSEDGTVAATQDDGKVHLWDTRTGKVRHEIELSRGGEAMKFSPDGKTLAISGYGHWLRLFSVETGKKLQSLQVTDRVESIAFSRDGHTLVAASHSSSTDSNQLIQIWDLRNLQAPPLKHPAPGIGFVTLSPDGKTLAWRCHGTLCFMERATGKDLMPTASHRGAMKALAYLPDGKRIVSASEDGTLRIWDAESGEALTVLEGHVGEILSMALYPNGKLLVSGGRDRTVRLWDLERGQSVAVMRDEGNEVNAVAFSADGKQLASAGYRSMLFHRDPATGRTLEEYEVEPVSSLAYAPDGKTLAALSHHGRRLYLQNLVTRKIREIPVESGGSSVAYSPDGKILAVACDETLLLLDAATREERRRLPGHYNTRGALAFSPDGRYLASVSDGYGSIANRTIRVFELASGAEIHSFKKELPIYATAFSPDGAKLAVGADDGTALILDLRNLSGKKRPTELADSELAAHWESLATGDAPTAYEARNAMLHAPASTVPFLARRLQPAPAIDARKVEDLIKKLDSAVFQQRDEATRELEQLGELAYESLGKALDADPPLEMRQRLQALLDKLNQLAPAQRRKVRAIEILETIATPDAFKVMERLTQGNAVDLLTLESRAALARKQKKPLPSNPVARPVPDRSPIAPPGPVLSDRDGDPMPAGAVARLGSSRWRLAHEPLRILVSADGKTLAVVNSYSAVELFDAHTGRCIERVESGMFSWGFDMRMAVALSPDWQRVATQEAGEQGGSVLAIFDRGTPKKRTIPYARKKEQIPLVPEEVEGGSFFSFTVEYLSAAAWSPDGQKLVGAIRFNWSCGGDKASKEVKETHLVAWDPATGKEIWKSLAPADEVHAILFSPDSKTMTVLESAGVGFWDAATGKELRRWPSAEPLFSARYSPDQRWLATGSNEAILLWEVATGKVLHRLAVPGKEIKLLAFSPDGKLLAGGGDQTIRFWNPLTGEASGDCSAFPSPVEAVAFSGDGQTLFSGHAEEHVLRRWDVATRKPSSEIHGPIVPMRFLSFSQDSRHILSSATVKDFYLGEAATGQPVPLPANDDGRLLRECLASAGQAALLRCQEGFGLQLAMLLTGQTDPLEQWPGFLASSVDGRRVLVRAKKDGLPCFTVLKVSPIKGKDKRPDDDSEREFIWKEEGDATAALSPDGLTVAVAGKVLTFVDVISGKERRYELAGEVPGRASPIESIKFSPDGTRIALAGRKRTIRILAVKDGRQIAELPASSLTGLAFSPDGQTLLTTSMWSPVCIWEVATGQMVRRLEAATYYYSPDNRLLAASADTLKLLDLYGGRVVRECKAEGNSLGRIAFSPDGKRVAASCSDTTILVWPTVAAAAQADTPLDEKALAELLEKGNAADAYPAMGRMIVDPERTLTFLERRLRPAERVAVEQVQRLIDDLNSNEANRREAAARDLAQLGALAEPTLHATLAAENVPVRTKKRIEQLLRDRDETQGFAEEVLHVRAIQVLERIGTPRARRLLETLAQGAEASPRTRAAADSLARLKVR